MHELDFAKIDEKRPIRALVSRLEISIDIQPNVPNKLPGKLTANEKKEFFMYIPGYELHKYSLLKQYNAIQTINNDLNNWLQEIVDFPNVENNGLQSNLQYHLMQEKLPTKIEPNKKPKL